MQASFRLHTRRTPLQTNQQTPKISPRIHKQTASPTHAHLHHLVSDSSANKPPGRADDLQRAKPQQATLVAPSWQGRASRTKASKLTTLNFKVHSFWESMTLTGASLETDALAATRTRITPRPTVGDIAPEGCGITHLWTLASQVTPLTNH